MSRVVHTALACLLVPLYWHLSGKVASVPCSQLLNTTVASIGITLNSILTSCYRACYANAAITDEDELMLMTAPISATSEVEQLYTAGLIDWKSALPASLHSLGCSANEITEALRRREEKEKEGEEKAQRSAASEATAYDVSVVGIDQAKANVDATRAQTKKTEAETSRVGKGAGEEGGKGGGKGGGKP